ncbi:MAG: proline dehydrogenase family protein [Polyangiaceae bacterium]|nr:proline dehydrogenase family protein [Polyangiaceae bacterium]
MRVTAELNRKGLLTTLDFLGESVTDPEEARRARDEILRLLEAIHAGDHASGVSVKPSQLGIAIAPSLALENMRCLLQRARELDLFVRMDMEESALVDATLGIYRTLRQEGFENTGVVIQSYLYRSEADIQELVEMGASVRLCKGAYMEPPEVAFPQKKDTDANFIRLMKLLLGPRAQQNGVHAAMATHDEAMVQASIAFATEQALPHDAYELQMLHGVRRELQGRLAAQGHRVRVYVPYGAAWYPYLMRRLAERPANLWFFLSNLIRR